MTKRQTPPVNQAAPIKMYRCTARPAHQWQSDRPLDENILSFPIGIAGAVNDICPHCFYAWLRATLEQLGKVEVMQ